MDWIGFFPSLYGKAVPGLCFLSLSLISVKRRPSSPVMMEQIDKKPSARPPEVSKRTSHGRRGRPKGSKNRKRRDGVLSPALRFVQETIARLRQLIGDHLQVFYVVDDGALGHHDALQMVTQLGVHVISKLRHDAALYCPYDGPYSGRGKRKKYGQKLDYRKISDDYLKISSIDKDIQTQIYQLPYGIRNLLTYSILS
jgi:putative transposase